MIKGKKIKILALLLKTIIACIAVAFIYRQVFLRTDSAQLFNYLRNALSGGEKTMLYLFVIMLVFVNWGIEALKWKFAVGKITKPGYFTALRAVFTGITVSFFTPNRVGEYAGRVFHLKKEDRINGVLITVLTSMGQLVVTLTAGLACIPWYFRMYADVTGYLFYLVCFMALILSGCILFLYYNISFVRFLAHRISFFKKLEHYVSVFSLYRARELTVMLLLSLARYVIFSLQFFILLRVMGVNAGLFSSLGMIALSFFAMTVIPTFAFADLGIRGSAALFFIGQLSENAPGILASSFALWLVNLAFPALIGAISLFFIKFFKEE